MKVLTQKITLILEMRVYFFKPYSIDLRFCKSVIDFNCMMFQRLYRRLFIKDVSYFGLFASR